jgi:hypothetical protein
MKTRFQSNTELANVWAMQTQSHGKGNNIFFEYDTAYSYGHHYIAAKFVMANNGEKVCFVNSRHYSPTTAKHVGKLFNAVPDGIKVFRVPLPRVFDIEQLPTIIKVMKEKVEEHLKKQSNARTSTIGMYIANKLINDIKEFCGLFGLPIPNTCDFKNYKQAEEKVLTIQKPS